jgi:hypothetical protein
MTLDGCLSQSSVCYKPFFSPKKRMVTEYQLPNQTTLTKDRYMTTGRDIEFKVGRRSFDGTIRLSAHPPQLLQLSVSYKGERSSSVMLTRDQIRALQQALADFEQALSSPNGAAEDWDHNERRENTYRSKDSSMPTV